MKSQRTWVFGLLMSLWAFAATSATFRPGDVIVSVNKATDPSTFAYTNSVRQFAADGTLIQELFVGDNIGPGDLKFSPRGVLHGAAGPVVFRFANDGSILPPLNAPSTGYSIVSLAFDRSGFLFATTYDGIVLKFAPDGSSQGAVAPASSAPTWADLDIDECTIYRYAVKIGRFDVCTSTPLTQLPTQLGNFASTLLVLQDGTLLASTDHFDMYRIGRDGTILRHYATHAVAYARDFSSKFVWISLGFRFAKFDLDNDVIAAGPFDTGINAFSGGIVGIAVVGAGVAAIPALSPIMLALLAVAVAISAIARLRS